jgi:hypothetical protein
MSEIRVNNITNREGSAGPSVAGIPVVDSNSHFVVPTGRTGQRYADNGENIVRDGLVLYLDAKYSYPGATGTNPDVYTWYDLSGNENHGELKNGVSYSGTDGGSLVFDGVNDYVTFSSTSLNLYPITLSFWATPDGEVINKYVASSVNGYRVSFGTGGISGYYFKSGSDYTLNYDAGYGSGTSGIFSYGTMTVDATGVKFYINGQLVGSNSWTGTAGPPTTAEVFKLGVYSSSYRTGNIAQALIYNRALTAEEVLQNFNATKDRYGI